MSAAFEVRCAADTPDVNYSASPYLPVESMVCVPNVFVSPLALAGPTLPWHTVRSRVKKLLEVGYMRMTITILSEPLRNFLSQGNTASHPFTRFFSF